MMPWRSKSPLMTHPFDKPFQALVIGASGAIGAAFVDAFACMENCTRVTSVSRATHPDFDLRNEESLARLAQTLLADAPYNIIVDATGALTIDGKGPEKALSALQAEQLACNFQVNAIAPVLLLRHLWPLLAGGYAIYAKLSARVGSISDNRKGGWYGYRAAKAALNMFLQTAAIELQRKNQHLQVVALQPGTVRSALSTPHLNTTHQILSPEESVAGLLHTLKNMTPQTGAHFLDYKGNVIEW